VTGCGVAGQAAVVHGGVVLVLAVEVGRVVAVGLGGQRVEWAVVQGGVAPVLVVHGLELLGARLLQLVHLVVLLELLDVVRQLLAARAARVHLLLLLLLVGLVLGRVGAEQAALVLAGQLPVARCLAAFGGVVVVGGGEGAREDVGAGLEMRQLWLRHCRGVEDVAVGGRSGSLRKRNKG